MSHERVAGHQRGSSHSDQFTSPLLTVGVPTKNSEASIESTLRSVLRSTTPDLRVIVSDNDSTDDTVKIVQRVAAEDARLTLVRQSIDVGAASNFQFLLERASTPFFAWVAGDDMVTPDYFLDCIAELKIDSQAVMAFGNAHMVYQDSDLELATYWGSTTFSSSNVYRRFWQVLSQFPAVHFYGVYRTAEAQAAGPLLPSISADTVFIRRLATRGGIVGQRHSEYVYRVSREWKSVADYEGTMAVRARRVKRGQLALELVHDTLRSVMLEDRARHTQLLLATEVLLAEALRLAKLGSAALTGRVTRFRSSEKFALLMYGFVFGLQNVRIDDVSEFLRRIARPALRWPARD